MSLYPLAFGLEIELSLISSRKHSTWLSVAKDISARLTKRGLRNQVCEQPDHHYRVWSLVQEVTIPSQPAKSRWAIELVSPVFTLDSPWLADLDIIFTEIEKKYKIEQSAQCSTHVHVSQSGHEFTPFQLASLSQAILAYEPCLDLLVPPERSSAYWCRSNKRNPVLAGCATLAECLDVVEMAAAAEPDGTAAVVETMCLFPASSAYGRAHGRKRDFVHGKVYKWNLAPLLSRDEGSRTIEFRQPAGSSKTGDAMGWVLLTLSFVAGAVGNVGIHPSVVAAGEEASFEDFWEHVHRGSDSLGLDPFLLECLQTFISSQIPAA